MARTDNLTNYLTDVASAIKTKKGDSTPIPASDFDTEIDDIESLSDGYEPEPKKCNSSTNISKVSATFNGSANADTQVTNGIIPSVLLIKKVPRFEMEAGTGKYPFGFVFYRCVNLEEIDLSGVGFTNITNYYFKSMFMECVSLKEIDLSVWNKMTGTSPSTTTDNIALMFKNCVSLKNADLSCFEGAWVIGELFSGCTSLEHIDIRRLDLPNCMNAKQQSSSFLGSSSGKVPYNCEIIVADQTQKDYMTTNFASYTNVKTVAEYEAE